METSALYGLSKMMGHSACTVTNIVANRVDKTHSSKYKETMERLVEDILNKLSKL